MSGKNNQDVSSTKVPEDDCADSGFLSGPLSEQLQWSEELTRDHITNRDIDPTQLDSGLDLTISEDLSNIKLSDSNDLKQNSELTIIEQPLINITEDQNIPPLITLLFQQDDDGDTQLHIAAVHGCQKAISILVRVCPDKVWLDVQNDYGHTALHLAVMSGHALVARMLVLAGASIAVRDLTGQNPLHLASMAGHVECINALLLPFPESPQRRLSAVLNEMDYKGQAPVHLAAMAGHVEALQTLVFYGADINAREGLSGRTALHVAALRGDISTATYLARRCDGVRLKARDYGGRTPRSLSRDAVRTMLMTLASHSDSDEDYSDDELSSDSDIFEEVLAGKAMVSGS